MGYVHLPGVPDHYAHAWAYDCLFWLHDVSPAHNPAPAPSFGSVGTAGGPRPEITNPAHPSFRG